MRSITCKNDITALFISPTSWILDLSEPTASISSKNNTKAPLSFAISAAKSTTWRIFLIVSPNNGDTNLSDSTTQIGISYALANALVRVVFPVPGGP